MDGTEKLCIALYGLEKVGKYIGGSDAPMLHDAAAEIDKLRLQVDALQTEKRAFELHLAGLSKMYEESQVKLRKLEDIEYRYDQLREKHGTAQENIEELLQSIERRERNAGELQFQLKDANRLNGELVEVARLAYNAFYSHTQPETNVWEADLREAIKELSADTLRVIGEANKPTSEKRKCVKCGAETGPGDPRCMQCIYEAGK